MITDFVTADFQCVDVLCRVWPPGGFAGSTLGIAIVVSWAIAFFEYCFQVPGNRIGATYFSLPQLKVMQEIITVLVFAGFSVWYMKLPLTRNSFLAAMLLAGAAYLIFSERSSS